MARRSVRHSEKKLYAEEAAHLADSGADAPAERMLQINVTSALIRVCNLNCVAASW
jgi:hypothetical protein